MTDMTDDQVRALLDGATENAYDLAVVKWGGGIRCVYLNDYRVAGEKPWGGGDTTRRFKVRMADIMQAFRGTVQAAAPDLARALLDARAEHAASLIRINAEAVEAVAQARADAQAAVALALEEAAENKEQLEIWAHEILVGLAFADVLKIDSYNDKIEAHDMVGRGLVEVIRALAPADALAEVQRLRETVEALVVVLDRNEKKGPIPDVEMMFCWLAAQDVRAAFRKIAQKGEAT